MANLNYRTAQVRPSTLMRVPATPETYAQSERYHGLFGEVGWLGGPVMVIDFTPVRPQIPRLTRTAEHIVEEILAQLRCGEHVSEPELIRRVENHLISLHSHCRTDPRDLLEFDD
jgi:hypothetical protein